jgi:PAS domain S-box-containing protein
LLNELKISKGKLLANIKERGIRAAELLVANKELLFQNKEKDNRAAELIIANKELVFQNNEKEKRAAELEVANKELDFQNDEKEKRAAELRVANYARSLIEASRDPLFTINTFGKITDMNNASITVLGKTRDEVIGTDFFKYFTDPKEAKNGYQEVFSQGFVVDFPLTIRDLRLTDVLFNGSVYKDEQGDVIGIVVVARDITEQKKYEKDLTEAKIYAENATSLAQDAKIKAEDAVKAKLQFLSNMSHEIRTPMNAIIGFTKVVLKTNLTDKQTEYLNAIKTSGDALIVLINDILDLAKVDAGKMSFEKIPFKMEASISSMLHLFETKIQEKNLILIQNYDKEIPKILLGDPVRLHQIVLNLISNAIKFTSIGEITVEVKKIFEDESKVQIQFSVSDTGIGISENKIGSIFENFQQATSGTSRLFGGTGLGLAIVKQLVEPQGGTLSVKSSVGKGSTFSFTLDFENTNKEFIVEEKLEEYNSENKNIKVLVVEDIPLNQLLMKTLLDEFGFERDIAANGKIALEYLAKNNYDIILMDLQMPIMNGFDTTEYIRKTMKSKIPIIALTADVTTVDLDKCKAVGMNDYLAKPLDEKLLYSKIVNIVKKPVTLALSENNLIEKKKYKTIDLDYLKRRTKSKPELMMEMIALYLEQTPPLIEAMKLGLEEKNWELLYAAVHKMIPSFSIVGISSTFENIAKKIQDIAGNQIQTEDLPELVSQIETICFNACSELTEEYNTIKNIGQ